MPRSSLPANHPDRAIGLIGLASLYAAQGQFEKSKATDEQIVAFLKSTTPVSYTSIAPSMVARLRSGTLSSRPTL